MTHQDKATRQYRVWLRKETVQQVKALALILDKDWNIVLDDVVRTGVAYLNEVGKLELAGWDGRFKLMELDADLGLRILRGTLPKPEER
jgi:hypothetical protein